MELKTERDFIKLLHTVFEHGGYNFPLGSILTEYKIGENLRPDIVIALEEPMAIVEVKTGKIKLPEATEQLKKYYESLDNKRVELYLVCFGPISEPEKTRFYQLNIGNFQLEEIKRLPNYEYFVNKRRKQLRESVFKSIDWLKWIGMFIGVIFILFGFFCILQDITISTGQFLIILLGVGVILLPFLTKIKVSGWELEFKNNTK